MPKKKEEESQEESEYEHNTETDDEQEGNDQDENDEEFILEKDDTNGKDRKGPTKKRDLPKDQEGDFGDDLPSYLRVTDKGGYAHTKLSRLRISHANKGNEPWNKGKNRSGQDKARISAGVRARNQALLEAKLKRLGMTQEEWKSKKKELKYVRERLRRARLVNKKKTPIDIRTMVVDDFARGETSSDEELEDTQMKEEIDANEEEQQPALAAPESLALTNTQGKPTKEGSQTTDTSEALIDQIFPKVLSWTPHPLDEGDMPCPTGGPGGLICCEYCQAHFTQYLDQTCRELEEQKIGKVASDISQMLMYSQSTLSSLKQSTAAAKSSIFLPRKDGENEQTMTL